jgi:hypothetical protein
MASSKKNSGFFDEAGFPVGDDITVPDVKDSTPMRWRSPATACSPSIAVGISSLCHPMPQCGAGDRVVVRTKSEVMAKVLQRQTSKKYELASFNPDHELRSVSADDVEWIARIIWASQQALQGTQREFAGVIGSRTLAGCGFVDR